MDTDGSQTIGAVPHAIPLFAGPGSISTAIIEMPCSNTQYHIYIIILNYHSDMPVSVIVMRTATTIGKIIEPIGLNNINCQFGLIKTAIAVEIIVNGLNQLFSALNG